MSNELEDDSGWISRVARRCASAWDGGDDGGDGGVGGGGGEGGDDDHDHDHDDDDHDHDDYDDDDECNTAARTAGHLHRPSTRQATHWR